MMYHSRLLQARPLSCTRYASSHSRPVVHLLQVNTRRQATPGMHPMSREGLVSHGSRHTALAAQRTQGDGPRSVAAAAEAGAASAGTRTQDDFAVDSRPVILYDGVCNLCNRAVNIMLDLDPKGTYRLAALQSPAGQRLLRRSGRAPDDISSIVLVDKSKQYIRSEAILRIAYGLSNPFPLLALMGFPVPLFFRDFVYDQVANNRYSFFGKRDVCRISDDGFKERFIAE